MPSEFFREGEVCPAIWITDENGFLKEPYMYGDANNPPQPENCSFENVQVMENLCRDCPQSTSFITRKDGGLQSDAMQK